MRLLIIISIVFSTSVFAKLDAGNSIRRICRPSLAQCEKDRMSLAVLNAKYSDIYFDANRCKAVGGRYCFGGTLNILYNARPSQKIDMIVDEETCNSVARTANDASSKWVN